MRWFLFTSAMLLASGCNSDRSCALASECFQGEQCIDGVCAVPDDDGDAGSSRTDGSDSADSDRPDSTVSADLGPRTSDGEMETLLACVIDPFGNVCDDDSFEPNEDTVIFPPPLFDSESWCNGAELVESQTSGPLTLCAGDPRDRFRLLIDNRTPNDCVTQQFTTRVEVHITTPCSPGDVSVDAELGALNRRCEEQDARFQCAWSPDGQTFTIEHVRQPEQLMDMHLNIAAADGRSDVQFDYEVTVSLVQ